jgi:hypothetical protein
MAATRAAEERATAPAYAAFISYSRHADARLAPRLESALERFARLAIGYDDGSVDLWDLATRRRQPLARASSSFIAAVPAFSAGGTRLAWGVGHDRVSGWDGRHVRSLRSPEPLAGVGGTPWILALSADGRFLAATGALSGDTMLWRLDRTTRPRVLPGRPSRSISFAGPAIALGPRRSTRPGAWRRSAPAGSSR